MENKGSALVSRSAGMLLVSLTSSMNPSRHCGHEKSTYKDSLDYIVYGEILIMAFARQERSQTHGIRRLSKSSGALVAVEQLFIA